MQGWRAMIAAGFLALTMAAQAAEQPVARLLDAGVINGKRYAALIVDLPGQSITYWRNPGDGGIAPEFSSRASHNLLSARLLFPAPQSFDKGGALAFGYSGRAVFPVVVSPLDAAAPMMVRARLDYGVCDKLCIPAQADFDLALTPGAAGSEPEGDAEGRREALAALARVPVPRPMAALGAPVVLSVTPGAGEKSQGKFEVSTRGGAALFVEAPAGWWFDVSGEGPRFTLTLAQRPKDGSGPIQLALTVVGENAAVETPVSLDVGAPPP